MRIGRRRAGATPTRSVIAMAVRSARSAVLAR